ncbi:MAG: PEP-CTERM sorting domain-containing protein [Phycisphaeraceae bacterium]|nr:PEP-CTERM sorting domain-containing protein [Phycisphaeraceae bacterium]
MTFSKALLLGCAGMFAVGSASAAIIVDDDVEGNGDAAATVGTVTVGWGGWDGNTTDPYFGILGAAVDGTGVLETLDGAIPFVDNNGPQTVTYGGTLAAGTYTVEIQMVNWGNKTGGVGGTGFPTLGDITLAGLTPDSISDPGNDANIASSDDEVWTLTYVVGAGAAEIGNDLALVVTNDGDNTTNYGIDHVRIDYVPEPGSLALLGLGGLLIVRRRRG